MDRPAFINHVPYLSATGSVNQAQDGRTAVTLTCTATGGQGALTYAWTWDSRPDGASNTFDDATSSTPAVDPDTEGTWVARCVVADAQGDTQETRASFTVGVAGIYEVLADIDYTSATPQDLTSSGNATYQITGEIGGAIDHNCWRGSTGTLAVNANGLEMSPDSANADGVNIPISQFSPGDDDVLIFQFDIAPNTLPSTSDRYQVSLTDQSTGSTAGANSARAGMSYNAASDYQRIEKAGSGGVNNVDQLDTSLPARTRVEMAGRGFNWRSRLDDTAGLGDPGEATILRYISLNATGIASSASEYTRIVTHFACGAVPSSASGLTLYIRRFRAMRLVTGI